MSSLMSSIYQDVEAARLHLEAVLWPNGPICPHCGNADAGTIATVGTVFERSHVPLNKWLLAAHLLAASKKGISSHQLMRMLGVTYKTA